MWSAAADQSSERRRSKRHLVSLLSSICITNESAGEYSGPLTVSATTQDISTDGLALIVSPSSIINIPELSVPGHELRVWIALPFEYARAAEMKVVLTQPARPAGELGYLIGVRIKEMSPTARLCYDEFIGSLGF